MYIRVSACMYKEVKRAMHMEEGGIKHCIWHWVAVWISGIIVSLISCFMIYTTTYSNNIYVLIID